MFITKLSYCLFCKFRTKAFKFVTEWNLWLGWRFDYKTGRRKFKTVEKKKITFTVWRNSSCRERSLTSQGNDFYLFGCAYWKILWTSFFTNFRAIFISGNLRTFKQKKFISFDATLNLYLNIFFCLFVKKFFNLIILN